MNGGVGKSRLAACARCDSAPGTLAPAASTHRRRRVVDAATTLQMRSFSLGSQLTSEDETRGARSGGQGRDERFLGATVGRAGTVRSAGCGGRRRAGARGAAASLSAATTLRARPRARARLTRSADRRAPRRTCREAAPAAMTGYARGEADFVAADRFRRDARPASLAPKDYSVPLHVDCSIEYELPDCAKPPQGVKIEPLLMIHPSHFRRLESLRRVPFVNNLPRGDAAAAAAVTPGTRPRGPRPARRCCRAAPAPAAAAPPPQPQPAQHARPRPPEPCYRFDSLPEVAAGGKVLRARLKPHPYLPPEALDCDIARALPPPTAHYADRFDKRALQQLPIFM